MVLIAYTSGSTTFTNAMWQAAGSPTEVELGWGWTIIDTNAFKDTTLTSIVMSASVTEIGNYAFENTAITTITISKSVTKIGEGAFYQCLSLNSVTFNDIANSELETIEGLAFYGCSGLTSIEIPASVTSIGSGLSSLRVFMNCTSLASVTFVVFAADFFVSVVDFDVNDDGTNTGVVGVATLDGVGDVILTFGAARIP